MMRQPCRPNTSVALALVALLLLGPLPANCLSDLPAGADVQEDSGQVTINPDPTSNSTTPAELPTTATIFSGVPGPSRCRGTVVLRLSVPPPLRDENGQAQKGERRCYNHLQPVGCGNFVASREAGCEARLFAEPDCQMYLNTAVFVPEDRAVGGRWRSIEVQCGIPAPDPDALGQPPLQGLIRNKKTGG